MMNSDFATNIMSSLYDHAKQYDDKHTCHKVEWWKLHVNIDDEDMTTLDATKNIAHMHICVVISNANYAINTSQTFVPCIVPGVWDISTIHI